MRSPRRRDLTPVGGILVSYDATAMPTPTIERLAAENPSDLKVLRLLLRIAIYKIRALEEAR